MLSVKHALLILKSWHLLNFLTDVAVGFRKLDVHSASRDLVFTSNKNAKTNVQDMNDNKLNHCLKQFMVLK